MQGDCTVFVHDDLVFPHRFSGTYLYIFAIINVTRAVFSVWLDSGENDYTSLGFSIKFTSITIICIVLFTIHNRFKAD